MLYKYFLILFYYLVLDLLMEFISGGSIRDLLDNFGEFDDRITAIFTH